MSEIKIGDWVRVKYIDFETPYPSKPFSKIGSREFLEVGDIVEVTSIRNLNIFYLRASNYYHWIPIRNVELVENEQVVKENCICSTQILMIRGCQCGGN